MYVDDSIVKRKTDREHLSNLEEAFITLRKYKIKIKSKKCVFGVRTRKLLAFMVRKRGIDANPYKFLAIIDLHEPKNLKGIQRLT